ncbi:PhzF family phenazine biosynthesis protein [Rhodoblastus sp.]|uniref:PhzF family phenazine biosynthesis protein n=1 Tax=Rhodoblastus sp. TaxID=1962975 RepID=UPI0035B1C477
MRLAYHLLDVFTDQPLAGNPLAVVPDAEGLDPALMQAIAREFNLSETVFVVPPRDPVHTAALRIFTPALELPFAGHPTIGAACLIAQLRAPDMIGRQPLRLVLEEPVGPVVCEVVRVQGALRASFVAPNAPQLLGEIPDRAGIAAAFGLSEAEIGFDGHAPVVASAGLPFAFVPVASAAALDAIAPDFSRFGAAFPLERPAVFLYTRETVDPAHHVHVRVFVPGLGAHEDPATGSAACAFAAVAARFERPEDGEHTIVIEQGFAMGRPSQIALTMRIASGALVETSVGGACVRIGEGVLVF